MSEANAAATGLASPSGRRSVLNPPGAPALYRPGYSHAVRVTEGALLFMSGQVAWDEQGELVGVGDPVAQTRQVFHNLRVILQNAGADLDAITKLTVYVTSFDWFEELMSIRGELFPDAPPASSLIQVAGLVRPEFLIEVDAVAAI
jgi:enamine deaminase RidA (YjgF/YER057c/UK114 family)